MEGKEIYFDLYLPSKEKPFPPLPRGLSIPTHIAFDGPQSLPAIGNKRRECDKLANTPTRVLPSNRKELKSWKMYKQLIECGIEIFWNIYRKNLAAIAGLNDNSNSELVIFETYPRYIIKRLWSGEEIPSKSKAKSEYIKKFSTFIKRKGYNFEENKVTSHDYIDAILCAIAAEDFLKSDGNSAGKVGNPPEVDNKENILREGFIYSP
ncbi:MAG: DUF429 domain-containing protein [Psychromonas sp.]|nr:DUF429 domain-containing protein [Psychromonas sp.]